MAILIETEKGTKGVIVGDEGTKILCIKVDEKYNQTGIRFAVEKDKAKQIGFIDYPRK